jgi:hypothetical protein
MMSCKFKIPSVSRASLWEILFGLPTDSPFLADVFKEDPKFLQNEEKYAEIKEEILGGDSDEESGSEEGSDEEDDEDGEYSIG